MNFKPAIILALVLCGCSGTPKPDSKAPVVGQWFNHQAVINLPNDDPARPWMLHYAWTENELFVTVHGRGDRATMADTNQFDPEFEARIYLRSGTQFKLLKRLVRAEDVGPSSFREPHVAWVTPAGEDGRVQLIQIPELFYGSGSIVQQHIFTTIKRNNDLMIEEVEFVPVSESFDKHLAQGEKVYRGEVTTLADGKISFDFLIEKEGDTGHYPTGGEVTGSYRLERQPDGKLRIVMDTFKRGPVKEPY